MFFLIYLRHELRHRKRQAIVTALGLAVGVSLVMTVSAASTGVANAQSGVLRALYGVGTDITVTTPWRADNATPQHTFQHGTTGQEMDILESTGIGLMDTESVASISKLNGVAAAVGALFLVNTKMTVPAAAPPPGNQTTLHPPTQIDVAGVDPTHNQPGPLSEAEIASGRSLTASDAGSDVAVLDANYANANRLPVGSTIIVAGTAFTVVGIADVPQNGNPRDVYLPLARAQELAGAADKVNTIYVSAASAADVAAVAKAINGVLPSADVTTSNNMADAITGSLASAAGLADDLGRWLASAVLAAAFLVASLLTIGAVSRRVREFGTLKALGWPTRRIVGQILGESVATGVVGGLAGVGLGFAGTALITWLAPTLHATVAASPGSAPPQGMNVQGSGSGTPSVQNFDAPDSTHTVAVEFSASVTVGVIVLAVALAIAGGLLAGLLGGWRAARLRPAEALTRLE